MNIIFLREAKVSARSILSVNELPSIDLIRMDTAFLSEVVWVVGWSGMDVLIDNNWCADTKVVKKIMFNQACYCRLGVLNTLKVARYLVSQFLKFSMIFFLGNRTDLTLFPNLKNWIRQYKMREEIECKDQ